jgi:hypothetical protein
MGKKAKLSGYQEEIGPCVTCFDQPPRATYSERDICGPNVVLIGFIMDSISNDFSHLSVGDLHASSEPSTPPVLNRISLERDTFTDDDHKLLDEKIENSFSAFRKLNEEPDLSDLLSRVTMDNERLTMLTPNQAEELLDREPSIAGLLRNGWQAGSFKEVRQLGVFPICSMSNF